MDENAKDYTHLQMEAALCIWEDLLERHQAHGNAEHKYTSQEAEEFGTKLFNYWEDNGTVEMRHAAINMASHAVKVFAQLEAAIGRDEIHETWASYDWDWIPAWVYLTVSIDGHHLTLKNDAEVVQRMIEEHYSETFTKEAWIREVQGLKTLKGFEEWNKLKTVEAMLHGHVGAV